MIIKFDVGAASIQATNFPPFFMAVLLKKNY